MENSEDFTKLRNHLYKTAETKWIYSLFVSVLALAAAIVGAISNNPLGLQLQAQLQLLDQS
jgi:hypothetical protein